jgi:hypothetical protein
VRRRPTGDPARHSTSASQELSLDELERFAATGGYQGHARLLHCITLTERATAAIAG